MFSNLKNYYDKFRVYYDKFRVFTMINSGCTMIKLDFYNILYYDAFMHLSYNLNYGKRYEQNDRSERKNRSKES